MGKLFRPHSLSFKDTTLNISLAIFLFTFLTIAEIFVKAADIASRQKRPLISRYEDSERVSKNQAQCLKCRISFTYRILPDRSEARLKQTGRIG
jgi:hypothetical protein